MPLQFKLHPNSSLFYSKSKICVKSQEVGHFVDFGSVIVYRFWIETQILPLKKQLLRYAITAPWDLIFIWINWYTVKKNFHVASFNCTSLMLVWLPCSFYVVTSLLSEASWCRLTWWWDRTDNVHPFTPCILLLTSVSIKLRLNI